MGLFFSLFSSYQSSWQYMFNIIFYQWLDLNCGPLELEATALPTEPQPLPAFVLVGMTILIASLKSLKIT